jgi:hypothetical protein
MGYCSVNEDGETREIDLREPDELATESIAGSVNIPLGHLTRSAQRRQMWTPGCRRARGRPATARQSHRRTASSCSTVGAPARPSSVR